MSILNRLTGRHLDDAALAALWTAAADGSREVITDAHLQACAECRVRFAGFAAWMEDVRTDARLDAEEAFSPARLAAQQAQILKRIEASERPARVIAFPNVPAEATAQTFPVRRWIAASAAAGLLVGLGLGQLMDLRHIGDGRPASAQVAGSGATSGRVPASATVTDDALLQELEAAATPQYEALRAFDTFTPRAADYVRTSR